MNLTKRIIVTSCTCFLLGFAVILSVADLFEAKNFHLFRLRENDAKAKCTMAAPNRMM